MANWQKFFDAVKDGFEVVADKAGEYGKKGRIKVEMYQVKRKSLQELSKLGTLAYHAVLEGECDPLAQNDEAKKYVEAIQKLEKELKDKEKEYEETGKDEPAT